ncbi:MAG TPA: hypothetical protein VH306_06285 [Gaiellaceae bacterium]|jgi:hypothetical protein
MAETFVYEYELRRGDEIVATGRFAPERRLEEGDTVHIDRSTAARVERVLPAPDLAGRLVLRTS